MNPQISIKSALGGSHQAAIFLQLNSLAYINFDGVSWRNYTEYEKISSKVGI